MNLLTKLEKDQIRNIIHSPQWTTFERVAEMIIQQFKSDTSLEDTEWATVSKMLVQQGKAKGVQEFFQELIKLSNDKE